MDTSEFLVRSAVPLLVPLVVAVGAMISTRRSPSRRATLETWLHWWAVGALGCGSVLVALSFLAAPGAMAETIGFAPSAFQFEIALANLAMGVLGFRAVRASTRERVTIGLGAGVFLWGAVIGHLYQWFAGGDHAPGNTGGILVYDVLVPAVLIVLALRLERHSTAAVPVAA